VRDSPAVDTSRPLSRHDETILNAYYGWRPYWSDAGIVNLGGIIPPAAVLGQGFGTVSGPGVPATGAETEGRRGGAESADTVVHSTHEATGYRIDASDGSIGHVDDFLFEDAGWTIQFLVVDTRNWLPGRKVLVAPAWIQSVLWGESRIAVDLSRDAIKSSPEYDAGRPFAAEEAVQLHNHYKLSRRY
jgi:hypothetical protein